MNSHANYFSSSRPPPSPNLFHTLDNPLHEYLNSLLPSISSIPHQHRINSTRHTRSHSTPSITSSSTSTPPHTHNHKRSNTLPELATANGETFEDVSYDALEEDDSKYPSTPPITSSSTFPSFSPLSKSPTSPNSNSIPIASPAFAAATRATPLNPLTLQSIARKNSETDALKLIREREERDKKWRSEDAFDKKVLNRPNITRKTSLGPIVSQVDSPHNISVGSLREEEEVFDEEEIRKRNQKRTFSQDTIVPNPRIDSFQGEASLPTLTSTASSTLSDSFTSGSPPIPLPTISTPEGSKIGIGNVSGGTSQIKRRLSLFSRFGKARSASISGNISPIILESSKADSQVEEKKVGSGSSGGSRIDKGKEKEKERVRYVKVKTKNKSTKDFDKLFLAQELFISPSIAPANNKGGGDTESLHSNHSYHDDATSQHSMNTEDTNHTSALPGKTKNAIWSTKFSLDGKYLAVGGKDGIVRVWEVLSTPESRESALDPEPLSPINSTSPTSPTCSTKNYDKKSTRTPVAVMPVFKTKPLHEFRGHEADVLDLSWSKNNFLLSSSMDKTVRLWHVSRSECLCAFQHLDFVTSIAFHPKDDRFFLSGSLDCKLRLWNIPEKRVHIWTELPEILTSVAFTGDGKLAIAGNFAGVCMFFEVETFRYHSQFAAKSSRGKNSKGKKITSMVPFPLTSSGGERLLVTSNDSRIRLFQVLDKNIEAKYAGHENTSSQIRASFSDDGKYIISGSEDRHVYIWDSGLATKEGGNWSFLRKNQEPSYESFQMSTNIITCASFAPFTTRDILSNSSDPIFSHPQSPITSIPTSRTTTQDSRSLPSAAQNGILIISDDSTGIISVFRNSTFRSDDIDFKKGYRKSRAYSEFSNS